MSPSLKRNRNATGANQTVTAAETKVTKTAGGETVTEIMVTPVAIAKIARKKADSNQKTVQSLNMMQSLKRRNSKTLTLTKSRIPATKSATDVSHDARTDDDGARRMASRRPPTSARQNRLTRHLLLSIQSNASLLQRR